jgi:hypothetical protein
LVLLLALGGGVIFLLSGSDGQKPTLENQSQKLPLHEEIIEPSELENMIERANYLYANGNQMKHLNSMKK